MLDPKWDKLRRLTASIPDRKSGAGIRCDVLIELLDALDRATPEPPTDGRHPLQPVVRDPMDGVLRFQHNAIVRFLLEHGPYDLNKLAAMPWDDRDRRQLAQLIGYSVDGFCDLSYVDEYEDDRVLVARGEFVQSQGTR